MTGKIGLSYSAEGEAILSFRTIDKSEARAIYQKLKDETVAAVFKKYRPPRSLDANAYAWVLIQKLSEATGLPTSDIYRESIRSIGGNAKIVCAQQKDVEDIKADWESHGLGWQVEQFDSKIDGCVNLILYSGSSCYDTAQMSRLIDTLIEDCREFNIETLPPDKLAGLMEEWSGRKRAV